MPDAKNRFVELPPQALIDPSEPELDRGVEKVRREGAMWGFLYLLVETFAEILGGLLPYLLVAGVLIIAIAVFFGVSVQAAIILLGLGAVGLGVLFAATQG